MYDNRGLPRAYEVAAATYERLVTYVRTNKLQQRVGVNSKLPNVAIWKCTSRFRQPD